MQHYGRPTWLAALERGTHGCFFYTTTGEFLEIAVPVLKEGLVETQERCLWIVPPRLSIRRAVDVLSESIKLDVQFYIDNKKLLLLPRENWFPDSKIPFDGEAIIRRGKLLLEETYELGYEGLRIVNHSISSNSPHWKKYLSFMENLDKRLDDKPITFLCAFSVRETPVDDLGFIAQSHTFSLIRHADQWHVVQLEKSSLTHSKIELTFTDLIQKI